MIFNTTSSRLSFCCAGDIATDDRSYEMHLVNAMDIAATNVYFYPRLIPIVSIHLTSVYTVCCWSGMVTDLRPLFCRAAM